MKTIVLTAFISIGILHSFAQVDGHGNPVFNSDVISIEKFDNYQLTSSYFTVRNNISDKGSSVYVSDTPTLDEYLAFSRDLPSYVFIIHRKEEVLATVMLIQKNEGSKTTLDYHITFLHNNKSTDIPCNVQGEISEKRVEELEELKVDQNASFIDLPNGRLYVFNKIGYRIQPYDKLKAEVGELAEHIVKAFDKGKK